MLTDSFRKIKEWGSAYRADLFLALSVALVSAISFYLGRISVLWQPHAPLEVTQFYDGGEADSAAASSTGGNVMDDQTASQTKAGETAFYASKNGSVYHLPDCPGAQKIKPENLIMFATEAEAVKAGYKPASNCHGLERK